MKRIIAYTLLLLVFPVIAFSQINKPLAKPKLVIGIVVDQMRWDYLYRYADRYGNGGFKRLMNEGFNCQNTFINYLPTYTAAGHSCVYTGSVPSLHGIMGNNWYSRPLKRVVYCTDDSTVNSVGSTSGEGKMSPANLWATTITDELRLSNNMRSKVIGIALKDRGAILPAGHSANAAYWFSDSSGGFITSTYYMNSLPAWLQKFNDKNLPNHYLQQNWNTLYPIDTYKQSTADDKSYESSIAGEDNTFPHMTAGITVKKYSSFRTTPYGNTYTLEMAKAAMEGENLGMGAFTDFLAVSLSSTDYIGHAFGPNSIEAEDTYLRLDKDLASFLTYLDTRYGKGSYTIFLTADHGVVQIPGYLKENKIPAGVLSEGRIADSLNVFLKRKYGIDRGILSVINYQLYLNKETAAASDDNIKKELVEQLLSFPQVARAFVLNNVPNTPLPEKLKTMVVNGYNQRLSGDIQFVYKPQFYDGWEKGTSHGVWNAYDSHIPLLWFGWHIKKGQTYRETYMTDIAATLAALLNIQMPSACIGDVIEEVSN